MPNKYLTNKRVKEKFEQLKATSKMKLSRAKFQHWHGQALCFLYNITKVKLPLIETFGELLRNFESDKDRKEIRLLFEEIYNKYHAGHLNNYLLKKYIKPSSKVRGI